MAIVKEVRVGRMNIQAFVFPERTWSPSLIHNVGPTSTFFVAASLTTGLSIGAQRPNGS